MTILVNVNVNDGFGLAATPEPDSHLPLPIAVSSCHLEMPTNTIPYLTLDLVVLLIVINNNIFHTVAKVYISTYICIDEL